MNCSDLDRYLEALLEQQLGRSRQAILRRHLGRCRSCRARIQHLTQFERELHRRFRSMDAVEPIWRSLELELVKDGENSVSGPSLQKPLAALPSPKMVADEEQATMAADPAFESQLGRRRHALMQSAGPSDAGSSTSFGQRLLGIIILVAALSALLNFLTGHLASAASQISALPGS